MAFSRVWPTPNPGIILGVAFSLRASVVEGDRVSSTPQSFMVAISSGVRVSVWVYSFVLIRVRFEVYSAFGSSYTYFGYGEQLETPGVLIESARFPGLPVYFR